VPLLIDIAVALYSTKIVTFAKNGFWGTLHEARTDVSMLLGLMFCCLPVAGRLLWMPGLLQEGFGVMAEKAVPELSRSASLAGNGSIRELASLFLRLGTTAFEGPAAHVAIMEDELVRRRQWLSREKFSIGASVRNPAGLPAGHAASVWAQTHPGVLQNSC